MPVTVQGPLLQQVKYPLVIYSHGLGGMRTTYSSFCSNLASHGMIVAAIEHRDLSAAVSMRDNYKTLLAYDRPAHYDDEFVFKFRRAQLEIRVQEVNDTVELLRDLDNNVEIKNKFPSTFDYSQFSDSIDWNKVIMSGHSFGSATAITVLQQKEHPFCLGIMQDPWMLPCVTGSITVPVYSLQSEKFHWKVNIDHICAQFKNDLPLSSVFGVVRGTAHQSFSDFCPLFPSLTQFSGLGGLADPVKAMAEIVESSLEFIHMNITVDGYTPVAGENAYFTQNRCGDDLLFNKDGFKLIYDSLH